MHSIDYMAQIIMEIKLEHQQEDSRPVLATTRLISFHPIIFFSCVINESIVAYLSGRTIVLENIRTHQQIIVWVCPPHFQIHCICKHLGGYGPFMLAIALLNTQTYFYEIYVFSIDWGSYFYSKKREKSVGLPEINWQQCSILGIEFTIGGDHIAILYKQNGFYSLQIFNSETGKEVSLKVMKMEILGIRPFEMNTDKYFGFWNSRAIGVIEFNSHLIAEHLLPESKFLAPNEQITLMEFGQNNKNQLMGFLLTDYGNVVIFKARGTTFDSFLKIDCRILKSTGRVQDKSKGQASNESQQKGNDRFYMPSCIMNRNNRVFIGYEKCRMLTIITYSFLNYQAYTITTSNQVLFLPGEEPENLPSDEFNYDVKEISLSTDMCTCGLVVGSDRGKYLMILDILNSLICCERKENPCEKIYGNYSCLGECISTCYSESDSSVFILHNTGKDETKLAYYSVNFLEVAKLSPNQILMWDSCLKAKATQVCVHPSNYTLMIIHDEIVKIHNYSKKKFFESHAILSLPKCTCGNFSPLGDKIVLANSTGIFIINCYTLDIVSVINPACISSKQPKKIEFISPFNLVAEYTSGSTSMLVTLHNYASFRLLGALPVRKSIERGFNSKILEIDEERKLIIVAEPESCLQILNTDMEMLCQVNVEVECIHLCRSIDLLIIGTSKGCLYMCRWPDVMEKSELGKRVDDVVVGINSIHHNRIIAVKLSLNYRFIFTISESGEIGITEFFQENSINISRQAALLMLKKWSIKPLIENSLTSVMDEEKRSEAIVKAIGKEVEINSKNDRELKLLKERLALSIEQATTQSEVNLCEELSTCEQERHVRVLLRKLELVKNALAEVKTRYETIKKKEVDRFNEELHAVFSMKDELEIKRDEIKQIYGEWKDSFLTEYQRENEQYAYASQMQLQVISQGTQENERMFQSVMALNKGDELKVREDKEETQEMLEREYGAELQELLRVKNELMISIRRKNFAISELTKKNGQFRLQFMELQNDMRNIKKVQPIVRKNQQILANKLVDVKSQNEQQVIQHRQYESAKQEAEKKAEAVERIYQQYIEDLKTLNATHEEVKNKKQSLDDEFYGENKRKIYLNDSIAEAKERIKVLKDKRNEWKRKAIINSRKHLGHSSIHTPNKTMSTSMTSSFHVSASKYESLLGQRDMNSEKLMKMNKMKTEKIRKQKQFDVKLIDDQKRLTAQLNELKRYNEFLSKKEAKLKLQISSGSIKYSLVRQPSGSEKPLVKKGSYYSLHSNSTLSKGPDRFITQL